MPAESGWRGSIISVKGLYTLNNQEHFSWSLIVVYPQQLRKTLSAVEGVHPGWPGVYTLGN
jgi:hypothetical protein